jgi:hypothetical protein
MLFNERHVGRVGVGTNRSQSDATRRVCGCACQNSLHFSSRIARHEPLTTTRRPCRRFRCLQPQARRNRTMESMMSAPVPVQHTPTQAFPGVRRDHSRVRRTKFPVSIRFRSSTRCSLVITLSPWPNLAPRLPSWQQYLPPILRPTLSGDDIHALCTCPVIP